jgi:hypothetical protein
MEFPGCRTAKRRISKCDLSFSQTGVSVRLGGLDNRYKIKSADRWAAERSTYGAAVLEFAAPAHAPVLGVGRGASRVIPGSVPREVLVPAQGAAADVTA